ncbi:MAG: phosphoribosylformylglycinamidine synthase, purS protein [Candidatus Altiarchaeales archaeon ex4484_96]|nr:MAG: phosphoribosylformylglycinamidine synthase, purS protein [Candidatus Altiarchaeales archaeon ex4484_96]
MQYSLEVRIELKKGVIDAEGETVKKTLNLLGYEVEGVNTVSVYVIRLSAESEEEAMEKMDEAARRLLANPVIQNYSISAVK